MPILSVLKIVLPKNLYSAKFLKINSIKIIEESTQTLVMQMTLHLNGDNVLHSFEEYTFIICTLSFTICTMC